MASQNQTSETLRSEAKIEPIRMGFVTIAELHKILGEMIEQGYGHLPVVASDKRASYPIELHVPYNLTGYAEALQIQPRPDARFIEDGERPKAWNRVADQVAAACGAFA